MARPSSYLIKAIRKTADNIRAGRHYEWGHMGACNCGHLAQVLTHLDKGQIHNYAMQGYGDWSDQVRAFCPTSGLSMDLLISDLISAGLSLEDLVSLERLNDQRVLACIPIEKRVNLHHNNPQDLVLYLEAWSNLLEEQYAEMMQVPA